MTPETLFGLSEDQSCLMVSDKRCSIVLPWNSEHPEARTCSQDDYTDIDHAKDPRRTQGSD